MKKFIKLKFNGIVRFPLVTHSSIVPIDGNTPYFGEPVVPSRKNSHVYAYQMLTGLSGTQGLAIYGNYAFRLNTGTGTGSVKGSLTIYDITDLSNIRRITSLTLPSGSYANHCNSCQFAPNREKEYDFPLLYVSGNYKSTCFVYRVTLTSVQLVQTIYWNTDSEMPELNGMHPNIQIGDDGFLWAVSDNYSSSVSGSGTLDYIYKFNLPSISTTSVVLSKSQIVESFSVQRYSDLDKTWQGLKIYNGKIYFLRGANRANTSGIEVIDITSKKLVSMIPLQMSDAEPEDLEIYNNRLFVAYNSNTFALLDF